MKDIKLFWKDYNKTEGMKDLKNNERYKTVRKLMKDNKLFRMNERYKPVLNEWKI